MEKNSPALKVEHDFYFDKKPSHFRVKYNDKKNYKSKPIIQPFKKCDREYLSNA